MNETGHEKRGMPRFPLQVPLVIKTGQSTSLVETTTKDVSATGVFVYLPVEMSEGSELEFTMTLPEELTLTAAIQVACKGTIVRVEKTSDARVGVAAMIHSYEFLGNEASAAARA